HISSQTLRGSDHRGSSVRESLPRLNGNERIRIFILCSRDHVATWCEYETIVGYLGQGRGACEPWLVKVFAISIAPRVVGVSDLQNVGFGKGPEPSGGHAAQIPGINK